MVILRVLRASVGIDHTDKGMPSNLLDERLHCLQRARVVGSEHVHAQPHGVEALAFHPLQQSVFVRIIEDVLNECYGARLSRVQRRQVDALVLTARHIGRAKRVSWAVPASLGLYQIASRTEKPKHAREDEGDVCER